MKLKSFIDEVELNELILKIYDYYRMNDKLCLELNDLVIEEYNEYKTTTGHWGKKLGFSDYQKKMFNYYGVSGQFDNELYFYKLHNIDINVKYKLFSTGNWKPAHEFIHTEYTPDNTANLFTDLKCPLQRKLAYDIYVVSNTKVLDKKFMNFCAQILKYTTSPVVFDIDEITYYLMFLEHYKLIESTFKRRFML